MKPPFPLQGLHDIAARPKDCILIVSGEKCREKIARRMKNFVVVSWLGGDQCVSKVWLKPLIGRNIVFSPDADRYSRWSMLEMMNIITQLEAKQS